jgi:L-seryl-tRNA(Ser) seleniumtransferase
LQTLPTWAVAIKPSKASCRALEAALRTLSLPIIARIADDQLILDLRTIHDEEFQAIAHGIALALKKVST